METGLTIIQWTQHYVRLHDAWYREAWVRDAAGAVRFVAILDDEL
jgi:hypothetical protein